MCFIDFKQVFDSIIRDKLLLVLEDFGIQMKLIQSIKKYNIMFISADFYKVNLDNEILETFKVKIGFRQSNVLSPIFFN